MEKTRTRKITIEVEVPGWVPEEEARNMALAGARRAIIYLVLEKTQVKEPTAGELEEIVGEARERVYRRIVEEEG